MNRNACLWIIGAQLLLASAPAWAYIDPGTGSMLVQSALALIAVILVAWRTVWYKVKSFFSRRRDDAADREV